MTRLACAVALSCALLGPAGLAQEPLETDVTEDVRVNLVMVEVLVMDGQRRTVAGLTKDDFTLTVQGREMRIDVFDVTCPDGALDDPVAVEQGERREPIAPGVARKIVLVFDYYHLGNTIQRTDRLREARASMILDKQPDDSVMIASLADGVRIEQRFTTDTAALVATLERMEYDASLYGREFGTITPRAFFDNLATVLDLANTFEGTKAVILITHFYAGALPINAEEPLFGQLMTFIISGYVFKLLIAAFDTIPIYFLVGKLRPYLGLEKNEEAVDEMVFG